MNNAAKWGGFKVGDRVIVTGTPHDQEHGTVVDMNAIPGTFVDRSDYLVPVFLPKYPGTYMWWFADHNLRRVDVVNMKNNATVLCGPPH